MNGSSNWFQATTLLERSRLLNGHKADILTTNRATSIVDKWKQQAPFDETSFFIDRLAQVDLTEQALLAIASATSQDVEDSAYANGTWAQQIEEAYATVTDAHLTAAAVPDAKYAEIGDMVNFAAPLLNPALEQLQQTVQRAGDAHSLPFLDPVGFSAHFYSFLHKDLSLLCCRTIILEIFIARINGRLTGETPEQRYTDFITDLSQTENAIAFLHNYPTLARTIVQTINCWLEATTEFVERLCADWPRIVASLPEATASQAITEVVEASDKHRGHRTVLLLTFDNDFKLVYKPKPLAVDHHFQQLLHWFNQRGLAHPFRTVEIIDSGSHGWMEFVAHSPCQDEAGVQRFYERQGYYLALLYMLDANDFHFENIIASGEQPILIDLESLFNGHSDIDTSKLSGAERQSSKLLYHSVLKLGLLPHRVWAKDNKSLGVDISGLGAASVQDAPRQSLTFANIGTDQMKVVREAVNYTFVTKNRPLLNGEEVEVHQYEASILKGFAHFYELLHQHHAALVAPDGPLSAFEHATVRFIVRPTRTYALLLDESRHPDLLQDAIKRDRFFDKLWIAVRNHKAHLSRVIQSEVDDLHRGDIPIFTTTPTSRDLIDSQGRTIPDYLSASGMDLVKERLSHLSAEDLERQCWLIQAAFATLPATHDMRATQSAVEASDSPLEYAINIGNLLHDLMIGEDDAAWISFVASGPYGWRVMVSDLNLYDGVSGLALYLAYLHEATGEPAFRQMAEAAIATSMTIQARAFDTYRTIGAFEGWGSVMYSLTHLGILWQRDDLLDQAERIGELMRELIPEDTKYDIMAGSAGAILALSALNAVRPSAALLDIAIQCGEHLITNATQMDSGVGWHTHIATHYPLTGYSHGAAGIAYALYLLATWSGDSKFAELGEQALAYERAHFLEEQGNWADLRSHNLHPDKVTDLPVVGAMAWCHGAPGIAIGRQMLLAHHDTPEVHSELATALNTTLAHGFGRSHCMCHGDLGNIDTLLLSQQALPNGEQVIAELTESIMASFLKDGWQCGVARKIETPGLMTGLAGIGYGLLRLHAPDKVPSILALQPPIV